PFPDYRGYCDGGAGARDAQARIAPSQAPWSIPGGAGIPALDGGGPLGGFPLGIGAPGPGGPPSGGAGRPWAVRHSSNAA
ncbi:MAG: hypothetical protein ACSLE3_01790, partial [Microbacteriaceae bacterium]